MTPAIAAVLLALLVLLNFLAGQRRVVYPPFIYSVVWLFDVSVWMASRIELDEVHSITWIVLTVGAYCYSLGGLFARMTPNRILAIKAYRYKTSSNLGLYLLLCASLLAIPWMILQVAQGAGGLSVSALSQARLAFVAMTEEGHQMPFVIANAPIFCISTCLICLIERRSKLFWCSFICALLACSFTGGRSYLMLLTLSTLTAYLLREKRYSFRSALKIATVAVMLFATAFVGLIFLVKDVSEYANVAWVLNNFVLAYIVVPLPALDYVLRHPENYLHTAPHTFGFIAKWANLFGAGVNVPLMHDSYVYVPLAANIYTIYKYYFTDFGLWGMFSAITLIGFLQTAIYRRALTGSRLALFISALLVFPAVLSIFDDLYSGGGLLQLLKAIVVAVLYFGILSRLHPGIELPRFRFLKSAQ